MKAKISKSAINGLKPGQQISDTSLVGFVARRLKSGTASYYFRERDGNGQQHTISLGVHGEVTPDQARREALRVAAQIRSGNKPVSAAAKAAKRRSSWGYTVDHLLDDFIKRHVRGHTDERPEGLRTADEYERCFNRYVRPRLGKKSIYDLKRSDITALLDAIEDSGAPVMGDRVLRYLTSCFNWQAVRDDHFKTPVTRGMARTKPLLRQRKRTLDDSEIRDLYAALDSLGDSVPACFPAFTKFLLLSAQRRGQVATMRWEEIDRRDWIVPEHKHKGKGGGDFVVPLTAGLLALIGPKQKAGYVFSTDNGKRPFSGFSKSKSALDAKLVEIRKQAGRPAMKHWTFHDLRRVARSAMARCGVPADFAEITLGHVLPNIRRTYDRYGYHAEKLDALERLGAQIARTLRPGESVVSFPKARKVKARSAR